MRIELLAPVGGMAHLRAAVNNGADAVYMGGRSFNARIFADNFNDEELIEAIDYAHLHGVKVYITFNILLQDSELARALRYANYLYEIGADALIVQDMGLLRLLRRYLPDFPVHLSTQATLYNKEALLLAKEWGCSRVVPARELSLEEIEELSGAAKDLGLETEIFVHGALCMCYSGQCQMSRMMGRRKDSQQGSPRTGNRGTCAQPCRQAYTDERGRTYYALSPKDLCLIERIPDLACSGASSFKIEGRMKTPEYVATVTRIYRKYIDEFASLVREHGEDEAKHLYAVAEEDMHELRQIFNRGSFTEGYLDGNPHAELLSGISPKNQGVYAGRVVAIIDSEAKVHFQDEKKAARGALKRGKVLVCIARDASNPATSIEMGDGVEFRSEDDFGSLKALRGDSPGGVSTYCKRIEGGQLILGDFDRGVRVGDSVFKVTDHRLQDKALATPEKKLPVTMVFTAREGQYPSLAMTDVRASRTVEITADHITERAMKAATEADRLASNLSRLGDTPFTLGLNDIDIELDDGIMMPISIVNKMRREACDRLISERLSALRNSREPLDAKALTGIEADEGLGSKAIDIDAFTAKISDEAPGYDYRLVPVETYMRATPPDGACASGAKVLPYILNISRGRLDEYIRENFDEIVQKVRPTGILIGNLGWVKQFLDAGVKVYGDYGLNVYNEQARLAFEEIGVEVLRLSHETGIADERGIPLMITEHPIDAKLLRDRKGEIHRIATSPVGDKTLVY